MTLNEIVKRIRSAILAKDVRESIALGFEQFASLEIDNNKVNDLAENLKTVSDDLKGVSYKLNEVYDFSLEESTNISWDAGIINATTGVVEKRQIVTQMFHVSNLISIKDKIRFTKFNVTEKHPLTATDYKLLIFKYYKNSDGSYGLSGCEQIEDITVPEDVGYYDLKLEGVKYVRLEVFAPIDYDVQTNVLISQVGAEITDGIITQVISSLILNSLSKSDVLQSIVQASEQPISSTALIEYLKSQDATNLMKRATMSTLGVVKLAGGSETAAGNDNESAVTPFNLKYILTQVGSFADDEMSDNSNGIVKNKVIKAYIDKLIAGIKQFKVIKTDVLPTENIDSNAIYFIPKKNKNNDDVFDEYMYINNKWELIGSTAVDLADYITTEGFISNVEAMLGLPEDIKGLSDTGTFTGAINELVETVAKKAKIFALEGSATPTTKTSDYPGVKLGDLCVNASYQAWICLYKYENTVVWSEILTNSCKYMQDNYYIKTVIDKLLKEKQDKLTAGDNVNIDSNNKIAAVIPERSWKKIRTIVIPSDDSFGQTIDGVSYIKGSSDTTNTGTRICRVEFLTDEDGNALGDKGITNVHIKMTPSEEINIAQGFLDYNNNHLIYMYNIKANTTVKHYELPVSGSYIANQTGLVYNYLNNIVNIKNIEKITFGGHERESVLGEGTKLEVWAYGYWDDTEVISDAE